MIEKNNFRQRLLKQETRAEKIAFELLSRYRLKVVKQKMIKVKSGKKYYFDLWLPHYAVAIEIDGGIHKERIDYDIEREMELYEQWRGLAILRFNNDDVLKRPNYILKILSEFLIKRIIFLNCCKMGRTMLDKADYFLESIKMPNIRMLIANQPIFYGGNNLDNWWEDNLDGFDMN